MLSFTLVAIHAVVCYYLMEYGLKGSVGVAWAAAVGSITCVTFLLFWALSELPGGV